MLNYLMSDRRITKAAHPIINAWRCQVGSVIHQGTAVFIIYEPFTAYRTSVDNDDDGEAAAGGRLAHLLQILVTGPDLLLDTV